jgi:DNA polymerase III delta prime subunit
VIVGHEAARLELEGSLPPVTLLLGPPGIGKTTLALHLVRHHGYRLTCHESLSAEQARLVVASAPVRGWVNAYVLSLARATEVAQNILLKVLEEPPSHCRFILLASAPPLTTVMSRSRVFRLGLLTDEQVAMVLMENCGVPSEHVARMAAARGRGRVALALEAVGDSESQRISSVVAVAVRAAASSDLKALDLALRNWTPEHTVALRQWAAEAATGRWAVFSEDLALPIPRSRAVRVLQALSDYSGARTGPAVALTALKDPGKP